MPEMDQLDTVGAAIDKRPGNAGPVGLFDSGIGGGTVLVHLHALLPEEDLLFLADQANCPYGLRPVAELRALAAANTRWLLGRGAKLIVVACNTASAGALHWLRQTFTAVPFVGMVPAVKPAARQTRSGVVGVLATPATIQGGLLDEVVERWAGAVRVIRQPCPGLAERIEADGPDAPETGALLRSYLDPLLAAGADTIVLGCTHYPYLLPQISAIAGPDVALIDAGPATARQAASVLRERDLCHPARQCPGAVCYATTGPRNHFARQIARLGLPPGIVSEAEISLSSQ